MLGCVVLCCVCACAVLVVLQSNFALAREYVAGINREVALIGLDGWIDRSIHTYIQLRSWPNFLSSPSKRLAVLNELTVVR